MKAPDEVLRDMRKGDDDAEAQEEDQLSPITKIDLDVVDGRGRRFQGTFVFKVPTLGDQAQIGALKAEYLPNGAVADPNAQFIIEQVSYLEVTLQFSEKHPRPDWWKPFDLYDGTPVSALYMEVLAYEAKFHGGNANRRADQNRAGEGSEDKGGAATDDQPDVGRKVRPPAERREVIAPHPARSG